MSLDALAQALPDYAKDLRANLSAVASLGPLSEQQIWTVLLASAAAIGEPQTMRAIKAEAEARLSLEARHAAMNAAAKMAMNNVYFRAVHLLANTEYAAMRSGLRASALTHPGASKVDFELCELAVSAINGCGACLDAHETSLRKQGVSAEQVQLALKIGAVVAAVSAALRAETV